LAWFTRRRADDAATPPAAPPAGDPDDSPPALTSAIEQLNREINRGAGRLPLTAVVGARRITDTLQQVVDTSTTRPLDVYALLSIRGIVSDYLPTTLRTYLSVDVALLDTVRAAGLTPVESLLAQLDALQTSASATLVSVRQQDADALMTQGGFVQTKFSRSDLDL